MVPTVALPPATPFTCHVTLVFVTFETVAVNCCVAPVCSDMFVGDTATLTLADFGNDVL
jgi:hypothetical protein